MRDIIVRLQQTLEAFCEGVWIAVVGHTLTWMTATVLGRFWQLAGHVFVGLALYLLERLLGH